MEAQQKAGEEKIYVTVRVRPLTPKEIARNESSDWNYPDMKTIAFKHAVPDRSGHPTAYVFDRVFGPDSQTQQVYEEGARDVALSALTGLHATIFAYGQTSSGKTYTMRGITENATNDIYSHIKKHEERSFVVKFSALEIYNEVVNDLLSPENVPLRLLDDPERGTIVEKLIEVTVENKDHLQHLLSVCEAQRQVGETALNDASSRSHQIMRLTVESLLRVRPNKSSISTLMATLNLVDLAGSERASQAQSEGTRLKEGCHINRSLLTLSTVIRKLSGSSKTKSGHVPYRDSKLTRILQHSLGGNARTAIICTMSPSHKHAEQSRNTLFFASCAKEVTNRAKVNLVMNDKDLIKQLQTEVARLEEELHVPQLFASSETILQTKDLQIQKMSNEMKELEQQRDLAMSKLNELLNKMELEQRSPDLHQKLSGTAIPTANAANTENLLNHDVCTDDEPTTKQESAVEENLPCLVFQQASPVNDDVTVPVILLQEIHKLEALQEELAEDASRALKALQKEVECLRLVQTGMNHDATENITKLQLEICEMRSLRDLAAAKEHLPAANLVVTAANNTLITSIKDELCRLKPCGDCDKYNIADAAIAALEDQLQSVQMSIDTLVFPGIDAQLEETSPAKRAPQSTNTPTRTMKDINGRHQLVTGSLHSLPQNCFGNNENTPPVTRCSENKKQTSVNIKDTAKAEEGSQITHQRNVSLDIKKMERMFRIAAEENIQSIRAYVTELKERVAKLQYQKQLLVCQVLELEGSKGVHNDEGVEGTLLHSESPLRWQCDFDLKRKHIFELWDFCHVSIIHRSQFYMLFRGEAADMIYMEVELQRLMWLQKHYSEAGMSVSHFGQQVQDEPVATLAASLRALKREREQLAKHIRSQLSQEEREEIYNEWDIPLDSKQRKMQLVHLIWTNPYDQHHIQKSAQLVAKLVGFWEPGRGAAAAAASKEMFELSFSPQPSNEKPWLFGWNWNSIATTLLNR